MTTYKARRALPTRRVNSVKTSRMLRLLAGVVGFLIVLSAGAAFAAWLLGLGLDGNVQTSKFDAEWKSAGLTEVVDPETGSSISGVGQASVVGGKLKLPASGMPTLLAGAEALEVNGVISGKVGVTTTGYVVGLDGDLPSGWTAKLITGCAKSVKYQTDAAVRIRLIPSPSAGALDLAQAGLVVQVRPGGGAPAANSCAVLGEQG